MRSMSMLQLVGGVAAAGVVAAGTTAFTAGGITNSVTHLPGAGNAQISVEGATLGSAVFTFGATAGTYDHILGITLGLTGTGGYAMSDTNSKVSVALTGSGAAGSASSGAYYDCGNGSSGTWTCTIGTSSDFFTQVDTVNIKVAPKV